MTFSLYSLERSQQDLSFLKHDQVKRDTGGAGMEVWSSSVYCDAPLD